MNCLKGNCSALFEALTYGRGVMQYDILALNRK